MGEVVTTAAGTGRSALRRDLVHRARALAARGGATGQRAVLGIAGAPGAGKSTIAALVASAVGPSAVVVPMDGFHLHDAELSRLGRGERKGAPDTFDVPGYTHLLRRLRAETDRTVYAPQFDRSRELSVAGAIACRPHHRLVVTEGNYLLYDAPDWSEVLPLLDESWFVEVDERLRLERLVARHVEHGRAPEVAHTWATVSDQANADVVARTRVAADVVVDLDEDVAPDLSLGHRDDPTNVRTPT